MSDILGILAASEEEDEERRRYRQIARTNAVQAEPEPPPPAGLNAFEATAFQNDAFE